MTAIRYARHLRKKRLLDALAREKASRIQVENERDEERRARLLAEEELGELLYFITQRETWKDRQVKGV